MITLEIITAKPNTTQPCCDVDVNEVDVFEWLDQNADRLIEKEFCQSPYFRDTEVCAEASSFNV